MERTVAALAACGLVAWGLATALLGCGGEAVEVGTPFVQNDPPPAPAGALVGRAEAPGTAPDEAGRPRQEPPQATADAQGRLTIPADALWGSVRDALGQAAARRRAAEGLGDGAPVQIPLPDGGLVVIGATRRVGSTGLALKLKAGSAPSTRITALGSAWVAERGCEAKGNWSAESWPLTPWHDALVALSTLEDDGKPFIHVDADAGMPVDTVLGFIAAIAEAGPPVIEIGRRRRFADPVEGTGNWLARHQSPTGAWDHEVALAICDGRPMRHEPVRGDPARAGNVGLTGLCLCTFLGAGYTNRGNHPYKAVVSRGLRHLKNLQQPDGTFPTPEGWDSSVAHALASLAMLEAYGMTGSPIFKGSAQRALGALKAVYLRTRADILPTVLTAMALKSALLINEDAVRRDKVPPLAADDTLRELLLRDIQGVDLDTADLPAAACLVTRLLLEPDAYKADDVRAGALVLANTLLERGHQADPVLLWLGTLASFRVNRGPWKIMKRALETHVVETQRKDGHTCCQKGSWDPPTSSPLPGGRVTATVLNGLCLQVFYRYDRVFGIR